MKDHLIRGGVFEVRERTFRSLYLEGTAAKRPCTESARESEKEFGNRATRGESGSGRPCAVSMRGSEKMTTINWTKKVDRFLQPPVHAASTTPSIPRHFSERPPLPEPSSCHVETRTHEQTQIHVKAIREKHTGFQLLGSLVS